MTLNLPPLPAAIINAPKWPVVPLAPPPLPKLPEPNPWKVSPDVNPTAPGWYVTRWRIEFPESDLYWDGVWWAVADPATGELRRLERLNVRNWSCEWKSKP